jgi:DnaD/phage-associated family protein
LRTLWKEFEQEKQNRMQVWYMREMQKASAGRPTIIRWHNCKIRQKESGEKMTGFQAPNYTQVPNDYFDLIMDMTISEIKVLSALLRGTLGYHRNNVDMTIREMARTTHIDPKSVMAGAVKLEERGLISRTVGKNTTITKWTVVIDEPKLWEKIVKTVGNGQEENCSLLLKRKKEIKDDDVLATISKAYESEIGIITAMMRDELAEASAIYPQQWTLDAIHEAAIQNKRGWKYVLTILTRWKAQGNQDSAKTQEAPKFRKPIVNNDDVIRSLINATR